LTSAQRSSPIKLSLAKQGILLVVVFLLYEIGFIGSLGWLLSQAEADAEKQEFKRQLNEKTDRLMLIGYDRGDSVGRYSRIMESGATDAKAVASNEIPDLVAWLKRALAGDSRASALMNKIEREISICLPVTEDIEHNKPDATPESKQQWARQREKIQPVVSQLLLDVRELNRLTKISQSDDLSDDRHRRELTESVLLFGMLINVIAVFAIAFLFVNRITSRLDIMTDNTVRLKGSLELRPPVGGDDELSVLDEVFHETADALRQEMILLKAGEERIRSLIENVPVGIVLLDTAGTIELVNNSIESMLNYSSHQLLGKRLARLFVPGQPVVDGAPHSPQSQAAFKNSIEVMAVNRDGEPVPVDFMMSEVQLEGESKTLAMLVDATEKHKFRKMRQNFVFMVRSELKDPLERISSFLSRFAGGSLGEISEQGVNTTRAMQQNIERLILLLNDLFDLEKLESGTIDIAPSEVSLASVFSKSIDAVAMFAEKHKVKLVSSDVEVTVYADANRLVQVLVNLLSNAIKFSPENGVVSLVVQRSDSDLEIGVKDQGPGIPRAQAEAIFEAYRQVEGQDIKKGGTGLGLTICKSIVEAHGGRIGVTSEVGKGSVFWFKIPLTRGLQP
jgi:PAS domain S-box-containing protein